MTEIDSIRRAGQTTYGTLTFEEHTIPVAVAAGRRDAQVVLVTGMQHGTEFSGPAALDAVLAALDPEAMAGTLVGLPFVNPFHARLTREEHSRMHAEPASNMNRQWRERGNAENPLSRLAGFVWDAAVRHADAVIDMHCCRDIDPRFAACLEGHAASEALAEAAGLPAVDRQAPDSYDARQLMIIASQELDIPALLVESRPGGYQIPEAVEACSNAIFRCLLHLGVLAAWSPPAADPAPAVFRRGGKGAALKATQAGYLAIRRFPARRVSTGDVVAEVRSMETFEVIESLTSPLDGGVGSVAEFKGWPFVSPGDCAATVSGLCAPRLAAPATQSSSRSSS